MEMDGVSPIEVDFKEELFASDCSVVFVVVVRGKQCVMKVVGSLSPRTDSWSTNYKTTEPWTRSTTSLSYRP